MLQELLGTSAALAAVSEDLARLLALLRLRPRASREY